MSQLRPIGLVIPCPNVDVPAPTRPSVSPARLAANRTNARRSTGPRTIAGKAASSRNATTHGLLVREPLLPGEDPAELQEHSSRLLEQLAPEGGVEELLADDIVSLTWRLGRLARVETALFAVGLHAPAMRALAAAGEAPTALGLAFAGQASSFAVLSRYETAMVYRLRRALQDLERLQAARTSTVSVLVTLPGGN